MLIFFKMSNHKTTSKYFFFVIVCTEMIYVSSVANFKYSFLANIDFAYNDIYYMDGSNEDCAAACLANSKCVAYCRNKDPGANGCWLKRGLRQREAPAPYRDCYVLVPDTQTPGNVQYLVEANTDYPGQDITYWTGDFSSCADACLNTPSCVAYVYHKDNGRNCWLKSGLGQRSENNNRDVYHVTHITIPPGSIPTVEQDNLDYPGNDLFYWEGEFKECPAVCKVTIGCVAYVEHKDNGRNCWLKYALGIPVPINNRKTYVVVTDTQPSASTKYLKDSSSDYRGNDLFYWSGPFTQCPIICDMIVNCVGYTQDTAHGIGCFLKSALDNRFDDVKYDTFIRQDNRSVGYQVETNSDYRLNDIGYWNFDFDMCPRICNLTVNCVGFVLNKTNGRGCWLKDAMSNRFSDDKYDTAFKLGTSKLGPKSPGSNNPKGIIPSIPGLAGLFKFAVSQLLSYYKSYQEKLRVERVAESINVNVWMSNNQQDPKDNQCGFYFETTGFAGTYSRDFFPAWVQQKCPFTARDGGWYWEWYFWTMRITSPSANYVKTLHLGNEQVSEIQLHADGYKYTRVDGICFGLSERTVVAGPRALCINGRLWNACLQWVSGNATAPLQGPPEQMVMTKSNRGVHKVILTDIPNMLYFFNELMTDPDNEDARSGFCQRFQLVQGVQDVEPTLGCHSDKKTCLVSKSLPVINCDQHTMELFNPQGCDRYTLAT